MPQGVLSGSKLAAVHTGRPVPHSMVAVATHGFGSVHPEPCAQTPHVPALHTRFAPQLTPFPTGVPRSTQTDVPVAQDVVPL